MAGRLKIGDTLEGKYSITRQIGEGGMGVVYEGMHLQLEMTVAIKVLHPFEADDQAMRDRFKIEARSSASIKHPNVVEVYDYGITPDGRPFFVMEYLEGESLADLLDNKRVLKQAFAIEIIDQILSGLVRAHKRNIIHRDLKPENIFLAKTEEGKCIVKILDFGIAKIAQESGITIDLEGNRKKKYFRHSGRFKTEQGIVMGTPGYMAPETLTGLENIDTRVDLFSVGVLLFEMLTGSQPFFGDTATEVMEKTVTLPVPRLTRLNGTVTREVEQLCYIALAKKPDDRFETAEEFVEYLTAAAVGRIPDYGRICKTEIEGMQTSASIPLISADSMELRHDHLFEGNKHYLEAKSRGSCFNKSSSPYHDFGPGRAGGDFQKGKYIGPPRKTRIILPFSLFSIVLFLSIVGAAAYFIWTSTLFQGTTLSAPAVERGRTIKSTSAGVKSFGDKDVERITLWTDTQPSDVRLYWNGELITSRPLRVLRSKSPSRLELQKEGYRKRVIIVLPDYDQTISAILEKE